jgi:hypothetical protein
VKRVMFTIVATLLLTSGAHASVTPDPSRDGSVFVFESDASRSGALGRTIVQDPNLVFTDAGANPRIAVGALDGFSSQTIGGDGTDAARTASFGRAAVGAATAIVASLPEPAAWAMMIVGFGGVGAKLRRKRRDHAFGLA